jgi:hypothetical protein
MKSVFAILALAVAVSAQATPNIPACASSCFTPQALGDCKSVSNTTCLCTPAAKAKLTTCITSLNPPCSGADIAKLAGLADACSGAGAGAGSSSAGSSAASTAEASGAASSAAATGAATSATGTEAPAGTVAPSGTGIGSAVETTIATATAAGTAAGTAAASGPQAAASGAATGGAERLAAGGSLAIAAFVAALAL